MRWSVRSCLGQRRRCDLPKPEYGDLAPVIVAERVLAEWLLHRLVDDSCPAWCNDALAVVGTRVVPDGVHGGGVPVVAGAEAEPCGLALYGHPGGGQMFGEVVRGGVQARQGPSKRFCDDGGGDCFIEVVQERSERGWVVGLGVRIGPDVPFDGEQLAGVHDGVQWVRSTSWRPPGPARDVNRGKPSEARQAEEQRPASRKP